MIARIQNNIVCWWSGGITSAVACKLAINLFGPQNCKVIMIDTQNEHPDTYRFKNDCMDWYGMEIDRIWNPEYDNIKEVWRKYKGMNFAFGAICSSELKRAVRKKWQKENTFSHQVFGFEFDKKQFNRAASMRINYPDAKPIFPLQMYGYDKKDCIDFTEKAGIEIPETYKLGMSNNNCWETGCVQGGIGYWQLFRRLNPSAFNEMAMLEHEITTMKGEPVTINKDQSGKEKGFKPVFLLPNPGYPEVRDLSMMKGREPKPLVDCNGFCGINDLSEPNETENEINRQMELAL